jgi:hypothetical protein
MRSLPLLAFLLFVFPPLAHGESCPSQGSLKLAEPHCELFQEPIFQLDRVASTAKEKCLCFYREAYAIVDMVRKYETESAALAKEFSAHAAAEDAGQSDQAQHTASNISARAKNHHGEFASQLEGKFVLLKSYFDSYFQSLNKLNQLGMNNVGSEISGFQKPQSEIPALWSVSVARKQMTDLQKTYLGKDGKIGFSTGIRKVHREAKAAESASGQVQSLTAARALQVGTAGSDNANDILHDPTSSVAGPHYATRGAATVAGGAAGMLINGAKVLPGVAGVTAAGITEYLVYERTDPQTLLAIGAGAIVAAAKGTVAGIVVSGSIGALQYAGAKADALRHEYSEFSKMKILQNRSIRAQALSQEWLKHKNSSAKK